jgi:hypothetical protein
MAVTAMGSRDQTGGFLSINPHQVPVTVFIGSLAWEIWETLVRPEAPEGNTHMRGAAPIGNSPSLKQQNGNGE